jgi:type IX secretion system PorP/SprF family membrane protein
MKNFRKIVLNFSILFCSGFVFAQQESLITMYKDQMNLVNPAFAGIDKETNLSIGFRKQWVGVTNAPESQMFVFGTSLGKNLGFGISATNDKTFIEKQTFVGIDFSYKLKVDEKTDLYFGLKAGGNFYQVNTSGLNTFNGESDPALISFSNFRPNIGIGAVLKKENFYMSLSMPKLLNTVRTNTETAQVFVATERSHLYLSGGYDYVMGSQSNMTLKPSFLLRSVKSAPVVIDYNLSLDFSKKVEIGIMYRSSKTVGGIAKVAIFKDLFFGYAYEMPTRSDLSNRMNTHEFLLHYKLK